MRMTRTIEGIGAFVIATFAIMFMFGGTITATTMGGGRAWACGSILLMVAATYYYPERWLGYVRALAWLCVALCEARWGGASEWALTLLPLAYSLRETVVIVPRQDTERTRVTDPALIDCLARERQLKHDVEIARIQTATAQDDLVRDTAVMTEQVRALMRGARSMETAIETDLRENV